MADNGAGDGASGAATAPTLPSPEVNTKEDVITSIGRWRVPGASASPFRSLSGDAASDKGVTAATQAAANQPSTTDEIQPVVETRTDLSLLLIGTNVSPQYLADRMLRNMQVITGVPSRYGDLKFQPIRDAFTPKCTQSAGGYQITALSLFQSSRLAEDANGLSAISSGQDYERDCMTPLASLPQPIRRVTGVLVTARNIPWCSATIIGSDRLLTSRHCFVDAHSGLAMDEYAQVTDGLIGFKSVDPHRGRTTFSVKWIAGAEAPTGAFGPQDDYVQLRISDGIFEYQASVAPIAPSNAEMPLPVWIVGSNANLGDLRSDRPPLLFTRGSSPKACAVLEVSKNGCLYHTCQTGPATSGAGMLAVSESGSVTLMGVHKAAIAEAVGCEDEPPFNDKLNLGVNITSKLISG